MRQKKIFVCENIEFLNSSCSLEKKNFTKFLDFTRVSNFPFVFIQRKIYNHFFSKESLKDFRIFEV